MFVRFSLPTFMRSAYNPKFHNRAELDPEHDRLSSTSQEGGEAIGVNAQICGHPFHLSSDRRAAKTMDFFY